jgi:hypothetical protein
MLVLDGIERLFWIPMFRSPLFGGKLFPYTASYFVLALENGVRGSFSPDIVQARRTVQ